MSSKIDTFDIEEDLDDDSEKNSSHFIGILVKCLALLNKLPYAVDVSTEKLQKLLPTKWGCFRL